jgi:hypothetical protein
MTTSTAQLLFSEQHQAQRKSRSLRTLAAPKKGLSYRESIGLYSSGDFLSAVLSQIWNHMNIAVSNSVKEMMGPILQDLPVPIHFIKLDLGDVPIKTENMFVQRIKSKGQRQQERIQIDFDLEWDGECDILLQATLSKSMKLTFGVQHIKLKGRFSLLLGPLTTDLPVVSAVQYGFTNPPEVNLSYAGCAKSLSEKLGFVDGALKSAIDSTLAGMLVLPYRMGMPIDLGTYDYLDTYRPPEGMLRIGVTQARGFHILKKLIVNDIPDVYAVVSLGASKPFRNTTKYDNLNPQWSGETQDFILYDWDQKIYVSVFDEDKGPMVSRLINVILSPYNVHSTDSWIVLYYRIPMTCWERLKSPQKISLKMMDLLSWRLLWTAKRLVRLLQFQLRCFIYQSELRACPCQSLVANTSCAVS